MPIRFNPREHRALAWSLVKWGLLGGWVGLLSGCASALFLTALAWATEYRVHHPLLLWGLPLAGVAIALVYAQYGKSVAGGNNLLLERIHDPNQTVPFRMAPLILVTTVLTHLFGGSAGREGTAVQMGGSLAEAFTRPLRLSPADRRLLLMSGISGGFGSVFGTPLAGTVFGLEVLSVGRIRYDALVPCFVASYVGDVVCRAWGVQHHLYAVGAVPPLTPWLFFLVAVAGALFAGASFLFSELTDAVHRAAKALFKPVWLRPVAGGGLLIALTYALGTRDYLGLGIPLIERSFTPGGVFLGAFALKILFTALTLGTGFKGGEVTPLFCIGATLGSAFARLTGQPPGFFAALGFVAVFAGAANTPMACVLMGIELFGAELAVPLTAACILCYVLSGHRGIYLSQQIDTPKAHTVLVPRGTVLRDARAGSLEVGAGRLEAVPASVAGSPPLDADPTLTSSPISVLRIFLRAGERGKPRDLRDRRVPTPAYQQVLEAARQYGLPHGTARQCAPGAHAGDPPGMLPFYVELLGTREALEGFCRHAAELLQGQTLVFKEAESWSCDPGDREPTAREAEAETEETPLKHPAG